MAADFYLGDWLIQPSLNRATSYGCTIHVRPKVMDLLVVLAARPGAVLSKDALLKAAWEAEFVSESALTSVVAELRQQFNDDVGHPWLIETVPKRGYRLVAQVKEAAGSDETTRPTPPPTDPAAAAIVVPAASSKIHRIAWFALALIAVTAGLGGLWRNTGDHGQNASIRDVAVLPFQNLSDNSDDELLAHAITDGLISELARLDGFERVIAHGSVLRYKEKRPSLRDIANELNVQGLITGTLTRTDTRVSVHVELIDARTERQLWSDTLMPDARTIVDVQRQVVRNIVRETRINITPRQRRHLDTAGRRIDPDAYELLVKARVETARINYATAVAYFEKALSKDPEMAEAWAELALVLVYYAYGNPTETIPRARADADRALQLDPDNAAARVALGRIRLHVDWDWDGAGRELRSALSLDPHSPEAHWQYGFYLGVMGRMDESLEQSRAGVRLDPHSPFTHYALAFQLRVAGHYADAVKEFTNAIALAHERPVFIAQRALSHALNGECELADADLAASGQVAFVGFVAAKCGRSEEARRVAAAAPREKCAADIYAALRDYDAAFACLEQRYASRDFSLAQVATAPIYADLHGDPRFGDLLRRMRYPR